MGSIIFTLHPSLSSFQYGPFHLAEDAPLGATVTAIAAWDADERGGDSWVVDYRLESGNEEEVFSLMTDRQTNEVSLVLAKVFSLLCVLWCLFAVSLMPMPIVQIDNHRSNG